MLGLALADALGARYEGGFLERTVWKVIVAASGGALRWTDDTQMAVGLAESLIAKRGLDAGDAAARWARNMDGLRGYGPGASRLLKRVRGGEDWRSANRSVFPDGSYGNGAAMRAAPVGLFFRDDEAALVEAAALSSEITHAHPLGVEGGVLIARGTAMALRERFDPEGFLGELRRTSGRDEYRERLALAAGFLKSPPPASEVRERLGVSIVAHESVVTALYAFCRYPDDFRGMIEYIIGLGGDTDTIGAMAGGMSGARGGVSALPEEELARLEDRSRIESVGRDLARASRGS